MAAPCLIHGTRLARWAVHSAQPIEPGRPAGQCLATARRVRPAYTVGNPASPPFRHLDPVAFDWRQELDHLARARQPNACRQPYTPVANCLANQRRAPAALLKASKPQAAPTAMSNCVETGEKTGACESYNSNQIELSAVDPSLTIIMERPDLGLVLQAKKGQPEGCPKRSET